METEKLIYKLAQDVAVMAETQKSCQKYQAQTTENINKLAGSINVMTQEAIRLESVFGNLTSLEKKFDKAEAVFNTRMTKIESAYSTWSKTVIGALFVASVGLIFKYIGA